MKVGAIPENLLERIALALGIVPTPILDTFHAVIVARSVMVATRLGVFDAVGPEPRSAADLAGELGLDPAALEKLLRVLVALKYLRGEGNSFATTPMARGWLSRKSPKSVRENMLLRFLEWQAIEETEDFVRTGKALDVHTLIEGEQWETYQRGMRALAGLSAGEVSARAPRLADPTAMLDIGGGHGAYAAAFCRRYPRLDATILDLPDAVAAAAPLAEEEGLGGRLVHRPGDAKTADLGGSEWDLVLVSQLIHHFTPAENRALMERIGKALRPGGLLLIIDVLRDTSLSGDQAGALLDLYFAITSLSGTFPTEEVKGWLPAELAVERIFPLRTAPGVSILAARKRA